MKEIHRKNKKTECQILVYLMFLSVVSVKHSQCAHPAPSAWLICSEVSRCGPVMM